MTPRIFVRFVWKPPGISHCLLAKEIGGPAQRIGEMRAGKRAINADATIGPENKT